MISHSDIVEDYHMVTGSMMTINARFSRVYLQFDEGGVLHSFVQESGCAGVHGKFVWEFELFLLAVDDFSRDFYRVEMKLLAKVLGLFRTHVIIKSSFYEEER